MAGGVQGQDLEALWLQGTEAKDAAQQLPRPGPPTPSGIQPPTSALSAAMQKMTGKRPLGQNWGNSTGQTMWFLQQLNGVGGEDVLVAMRLCVDLTQPAPVKNVHRPCASHGPPHRASGRWYLKSHSQTSGIQHCHWKRP